MFNVDTTIHCLVIELLLLIVTWPRDLDICWQLSVSVDKCGVLHIGKQVAPTTFAINNFPLPVVTSYRDLGITITCELSPSPHINDIVTKAHCRANMIHRCFVSRNINLLTRAFITYVRPLLEYNCVAWSPHLKRDIELIEQVQRRFTKRLSGLSGYSYDERLKLLNLDSLQYRRIRFDIIMCYKIIFGLVCIDRDEFFQLRLSTTRGHPYKLYKHFSKCSVRSSFFLNVLSIYGTAYLLIVLVWPLCLHSRIRW